MRLAKSFIELCEPGLPLDEQLRLKTAGHNRVASSRIVSNFLPLRLLPLRDQPGSPFTTSAPS
jgi:hypothetical protein